MSGEANRDRAANWVVREVRIADNIRFKMVVDPDAASGNSGYGVDPISEAILNDRPNPSLYLLRLMLSCIQPGDVVLDLGAHIGSFALAAAARGCRVIAVEASPDNANLIRESIRVNQWSDRCQVIHAAVSDRDGELAFTSYGPWGHVWNAQTDMPAKSVPAIRVDTLLQQHGCERLDFIKMDVEGSEVAALSGAAKWVARQDAPRILYESNYIGLGYYNRSPRELRAALVQYGYPYHYLVHPQTLVPVSPEDMQPEVVGEYLCGKQPIPPLPGWSICPPLSPRELLAMLKSQIQVPDVRHRLYLARELREAPPELRHQPAFDKLMRILKADASEEVRETAAWYKEQPTPWFLRLFRGNRRTG